jgi:hypothetical protein
MKLTLFFALINAANAARLSQDSTTDASNEPETPSVPDVDPADADVPTYDPEDVPAELQPVDDTEGQIIMSLVEGCPDQVQAMRQCYNEDDAHQLRLAETYGYPRGGGGARVRCSD